jgi:hypothetical protein
MVSPQGGQSRIPWGRILLLVTVLAAVLFWSHVKAAFQPGSGPSNLNGDDRAAIVRIGDGKALTDAGYAIVRRDGALTLWGKQHCTTPDNAAACNKETSRQFRVHFSRNWRGSIDRVEVTQVWLLGDPVSDDSGAIRPLVGSCFKVYGATVADLLTQPLPSKYCK